MKKFICLYLISFGSVFVNAQSGGEYDYSNTLDLVKSVPQTEVRPAENYVSESDIMVQRAINSNVNHEPDFKLEFKDKEVPKSDYHNSSVYSVSEQEIVTSGPRGITDFQNGIINGEKIFNVNRQEDIRENVDVNKYYYDRNDDVKGSASRNSIDYGLVVFVLFIVISSLLVGFMVLGKDTKGSNVNFEEVKRKVGE
ncbi:hypothetical protein ACT4R9_00050 [Ornithobacterium rhinotracheale]|uniref:hypothetical protein n=1 Tax=Ornithobacterium rhinotracheale TaxID=28251 RepID=UPI003FA42D49